MKTRRILDETRHGNKGKRFRKRYEEVFWEERKVMAGRKEAVGNVEEDETLPQSKLAHIWHLR